MNRRAVLAGFFAASVACATFDLVVPSPGEDQDGDSTLRFVLYYTGEARGVLEPCGCTSGQLGGISRRASYLARRVSREAVPALLVDHGGLIDRPDRQSEIKFEVALDAARAMGYDAINVGAGDLLLGLGRLSELAGSGSPAILSANIVRADGSHPFEAYRVFDLPDLPSVAVLGVLAPPAFGSPQGGSPQGGSTYEVLEPVAALETPLAEARGKARNLVVLAHGSGELAREIAGAYPDVAVVIYGAEEPEPGAHPERVGETLLASPGWMGRHVGRIEVEIGVGVRAKARDPEPVPLGAEFADDPGMEALLLGYQEILEFERLVESLPRGTHPRGGFAGSEACRSCHERAFGVWEKTSHAHAFDVLVREKHAWDPECARCHSTGIDWRTGFESLAKTPEHARVGCEACHGPAAEHARAAGHVEMGAVGEVVCRTCHTSSQTPHFDFETFFEKIEHGS